MAVDVILRPALDWFHEILAARSRNGESVKAGYLFGSCARGINRPDSDADVAVYFDSEQRTRAGLLKERFELSGEVYDIWRDTGIRIQPWVFASEALANPELDESTHLLNTILTEGAAA